jgi:hypothetical protein
MYTFSVDVLILILFSFIVGGVFYLNRRFGISFLSPAMFFVVIHGLSMVGGYFFYDNNADGASVALEKDNSIYSGVVLNCLFLIISAFFGAFFVFLKNRKKYKIKINNNLGSFFNVKNRHVLTVVVLGLLVFIFGNGFDEMFHRREYMVESNAIAKILGTMLTLAASFMLGLNFQKLGVFRSCSLILLIVLIELSFSSRMSGVSMMLFGSGVVIYGNSFKYKFLFFSSVFIAIVFIHVSLFMRGESEQGLVPLLIAIGGTGVRGVWSDFSISTVLNNLLLVNFAITSLTVTDANISLSYVVTALNPMPGFMTDWYSLDAGINKYTPYSSMGELLNFSFLFSVVFYFLLGMCYAYVDVKSRKDFVFYGMIGWALMNISALDMLQYSTRSSMRFFYYFIILLIVRYFLKIIFRVKFR